jgi:DNA-directed RNA polymerase specialized sigma24 family protein
MPASRKSGHSLHADRSGVSDSGQSVSHWIVGLKAGDEAAIQKLWKRYFEQVVRLARKKLGTTPRRVMDEEDVAQSVMKSLCLGAARGQFPELSDRDNLWGLLIVLTTRKSADHVMHLRRQKRGAGRVRGESVLDGAEPSGSWAGGLEAILDQDPGPATLVELEEGCRRLLDRLGDDTLRRIALWKMEGYTRDEIAEKLGCARRTVARKLELIRKMWLAAEGES